MSYSASLGERHIFHDKVEVVDEKHGHEYEPLTAGAEWPLGCVVEADRTVSVVVYRIWHLNLNLGNTRWRRGRPLRGTRDRRRSSIIRRWCACLCRRARRGSGVDGVIVTGVWLGARVTVGLPVVGLLVVGDSDVGEKLVGERVGHVVGAR